MIQYDHITSKEELRWYYMILQLAERRGRSEHAKMLKSKIRAYVHEPVSEIREIYDDGCKYITLNPLPEALQTEAEAEQYVGDHMWIPQRSDWRRVPGDIYSTRFKLCRRRGRWWVYLYYLVIQD